MIEEATESAEETFDPEERALCPDETCIGVIGPGGRCKVCGLAAAPGTGVEAAAEMAQAEGPASSEVAAVAPGQEEGEDDFAERRLCPDGACIGVIGWDGRCKVCGRSGSLD